MEDVAEIEEGYLMSDLPFVEIKERHRDNRYEIFVDRKFIGNLYVGDFDEEGLKKLLASSYAAGQKDIQRKMKSIVRERNGEIEALRGS